MIEFQDKMSLHIALSLLFMNKPFKYRSRKPKMSYYSEKTVKRLKIVKFTKKNQLSIEQNSDPIGHF